MKKLYVDIDAVFTLSNSNSSIEFLFEKDVIHNLYLINNQLNYELVMVVNDANDRYVSAALSFLKNESILFQIERNAYENNNNIQHITKAGLTSWNDVFERLKTSSRKVSHTRNTNETQIEITLNPDGTGVYNISTGLGFFNHMLEQFSKHSLIDVSLTVKGDLHIDEHHTIEDVAIALGEAILKAVGDKKGMQRYGFLLPMDDCLAQVAVDFGGRSWLVWDADFKREKIGDVPTEMFYHFFKSFSDGAKCNLNIKAEGTNEHHKIESVFKAFAKAVKMAIAVNYESNVLPTTKGVL